VRVQARYRYRIEPSLVQRSMLARTFGCCRVVFNDALRVREDSWKTAEKLSPSEVQRRVITQAKTREERGWLAEVASVALVQSVRDAHRAYQNFFDSHASRRRGRRWGVLGSSRARTTGSRSGLPAMGSVSAQRPVVCGQGRNVRVRWSRALPSEPSSVTVIREPDGH